MGTFVVLSAVVLAGCGIFSPDKTDNPPPPPPAQYVIPSVPGYVLTNLEIAYANRDSTAYKDVYDSSYVGTSEDLNDPPGTVPSSFTYFDEISHLAALARVPTISSVTFRLGPPSSWTRLPSGEPSHPEWAVIQISGTSLDIQITDGVDTYITKGENEFFEFSFQPTTPAASPTDTLWKIVKWRESRAAGP